MINKGMNFAIDSWPVLALAAPIAGVIAGVIVTNVAHRLWQAGLISVPVVLLSMIGSMVIVGLLVFKMSPGELRIHSDELIVDRVLFLDRRIQLAEVEISLVRWYPDWTPVARGLQLHLGNTDTLIRLGVSSLQLLEQFESQRPAIVDKVSTRMPHAVISPSEFLRLLEHLGTPANDILGVARGAG
ncbi:MAG: hypothetical protein AB8B87_09880 [Granulosicoccus sp.]